MRAAVLHEYGTPRADEFQEPSAGEGQALVEVLAAGLNPVDVAICAGRFYAGKPPLPSVAGRVVAAARSQEGLERCLALGADAAVSLQQDAGELPGAFADAADGRIDVVLDPLFGQPFAAAVGAASFRARIVQIGAGAGAEATVSSAPIRGKLLEIMGHTNFAAPPPVKREAYARLADAAAAGQIQVEADALALDRVDEAWRRLQAGSHRKIVLVP